MLRPPHQDFRGQVLSTRSRGARGSGIQAAAQAAAQASAERLEMARIAAEERLEMWRHGGGGSGWWSVSSGWSG